MNRLADILKNQYFNCTFLPFSAGTFFVVALPSVYSVLALILIAVICLVTCMIAKNARKTLVFICLGTVLATLNGIRVVQTEKYASSLDSREILIEGVVTFSGADSVTVATDTVNGTDASLPITVRSTAFKTGDRVKGRVFVTETVNFSSRYDGIILNGTNPTLEKTGSSFVRSLVGSAKEKCSGILDALDTGFAKAIVTGDRTGDISGIIESMRQAGTSHLLAISGLHTSIIIMIASYIFDVIFPTLWVKKSATVVFALFYALMTGLSPSVVRCAIMTSFIVFSSVFRRTSLSVSALILSSSLILAISPFSAVDVSFLLSHLAVFSIITVANPMIRSIRSGVDLGQKRSRFSRLLIRFSIFSVSYFLTGVCVTFFTLPVCLLYFGRVNLFSWVINTMLIPLFSPILFLAVIYLIAMLLHLSWLGGVIAKIYGILSGFFLSVGSAFSEVSSVSGYPDYFRYAVSVAVVVTVGIMFVKKVKFKTAIFAITFSLFAFSLCGLAF